MSSITRQAPGNVAVTAPALTLAAADTLRRAFINEWKVAPQSNDRLPAPGAVVKEIKSPSARRSSTRRKHQVMLKEWSRARHD